MSIKHSVGTAFRKNILPGLVLQFFAFAIVCIYFFLPAVKPVFNWFGELKQTYGFYYSFVATSFFGGLIPFCYLWFNKRFDASQDVKKLFLFYVLCWGLRGVEVDFFYRLQGVWFGYDNTVKTIMTKALVDQLIYSVFWVAPVINTVYLWMESGFNIRATCNGMNREFFYVKMPRIILANWLVWFPAVSIIYTMPNELQIPLFNLVLCFWVLLLAVLNKK